LHVFRRSDTALNRGLNARDENAHRKKIVLMGAPGVDDDLSDHRAKLVQVTGWSMTISPPQATLASSDSPQHRSFQQSDRRYPSFTGELRTAITRTIPKARNTF